MKVPCKFKIKVVAPCVGELEDADQYVELAISHKSKQLETIQLEAKDDPKTGTMGFTGIANFSVSLRKAGDGAEDFGEARVALALEASGEDLGGGKVRYIYYTHICGRCMRKRS